MQALWHLLPLPHYYAVAFRQVGCSGLGFVLRRVPGHYLAVLSRRTTQSRISDRTRYPGRDPRRTAPAQKVRDVGEETRTSSNELNILHRTLKRITYGQEQPIPEGSMLVRFRNAALCAASLVLLCISPSIAEPVVLTISGEVEGGEIHLTLHDLETMGSAQIVTATPWHEGEVTFEGVPLDRLMHEIGATGETAFVRALNDYTTEIPIGDFARFQPILAFKTDGHYMEVSNKGPLFVVYPYDHDPTLQSELYYSRSAWQVRSIEIE